MDQRTVEAKPTGLFAFRFYLDLLIGCFFRGMIMEGIVAREAFLLAVQCTYSDGTPVRSITDAALEGIKLQADSVRFA